MEKINIYNIVRQGSDFFECREKAVDICKAYAEAEYHTDRDWELMYDFCFRGMDADVHIPLWASECLGEKVLQNRTTLEVIEFYHKWGYEPEWIEGNPADYIGEQLKFTAYLIGAECENNCDRVDAVNEFMQNYLLTTLSVIFKSLKEYKECYSTIIRFVGNLLSALSERI